MACINAHLMHEEQQRVHIQSAKFVQKNVAQNTFAVAVGGGQKKIATLPLPWCRLQRGSADDLSAIQKSRPRLHQLLPHIFVRSYSGARPNNASSPFSTAGLNPLATSAPASSYIHTRAGYKDFFFLSMGENAYFMPPSFRGFGPLHRG